ncbi:MAG: 2TM domain-containing protein [Acidimicrobiia bacterium]|nr:2TM domain-containing protein [Acidimicrobiia bacterium]MDH4306270.1 2TM domain-containing protein [Acidimicrobiia bacterium]MDH5292258.1 2TM domain-containing protein [Acidimicrobiia bacterium]
MAEDDVRRLAALERLEEKRRFRTHAVVYVLVNALLVSIWAVQDADGFWPFWTIFGWGLGLAIHGWKAYYQSPITEAEIAREMDRGA